MCVFIFSAAIVTIVALLQLYWFSNETTYPKFSVMTLTLLSELSLNNMSAAPKDYYNSECEVFKMLQAKSNLCICCVSDLIQNVKGSFLASLLQCFSKFH